MDSGPAGRARVRIAVIVPVGPRDNLLDTLASVVHYTDPSRVIIVIDDGSALTTASGHSRDLPEDIVVLQAPAGAPGSHGGLWVKLASGYRWVLGRYEPQVILRLDADALLIGHGLESLAERTFARNPQAGLLGSYKVGPDGGRRDFSWAARRLRTETGIRGLRYPQRRTHLRRYLSLARENGYTDGESALGGAYIHSYNAANRIYLNGWFDQPWLATSQLGEDHIMALLTVAAGYQVHDFGGPGDPLALRWRGLPAHPADLLATGKLVTHSVRSWGNLDEEEIRGIFEQARIRDRSPQ
jgi:glycosyltransferase involved in cell wall biosynthesis